MATVRSAFFLEPYGYTHLQLYRMPVPEYRQLLMSHEQLREEIKHARQGS